jgi:hypothetical protein
MTVRYSGRACYAEHTVSFNRATAFVVALVGIATAAFIEFGTPRATDVERSFGWFAYEAGPFVLVAVLALLSPFARALSLIGGLLLAIEAYAYVSVFLRTGREDAALIYLFKPFYALAIIGAGVLAGFLVARARRQADYVPNLGPPSIRRHRRKS